MGELFATNPAAPVSAQPTGTGMTVMPGSELSAGIAPATLKLVRGGQVRICSRSHLTVKSGSQGLLLAMSAGSLEVNYPMDRSASDLLVTPDFNIRMVGPGVYHFALGLNARGDTCFKALPGNTAGVVFSDSLGTDLVGVAADESAFFAEGKLAGRTRLDEPCGCPIVTVPALVAGGQAENGARADGDSSAPVPAANHEVNASPPPAQPGQRPLQVETPFVFSANAAALPGAAAQIDFSVLPNVFLVQDDVDPVVLTVKAPKPPPRSAKPEPTPAAAQAVADHPQEPEKRNEKKGVMARVKGFFGSLFHH